jgi:hypothetical protein
MMAYLISRRLRHLNHFPAAAVHRRDAVSRHFTAQLLKCYRPTEARLHPTASPMPFRLRRVLSTTVLRLPSAFRTHTAHQYFHRKYRPLKQPQNGHFARSRQFTALPNAGFAWSKTWLHGRQQHLIFDFRDFGISIEISYRRRFSQYCL